MAACGGPERCIHRTDFTGIEMSRGELPIGFDPVDMTGELKMGKEPSVAEPDVFDGATYEFQKKENGELFAIPKDKPGVAAKTFVLPFECKDTMELYTEELVGKEVSLVEDTREGMYPVKIYDAGTKENLLLKVMLRMASTHMLEPPTLPEMTQLKLARISAVNYRDIYVQFKPEYADMILYTLDLSVEQALKNGRSLYTVCEPDMETMYVLRYKTKGQFYRAKAIQVDGLKAVVHLVDYGSMLEVPNRHLYKLSDICPELLQVPAQAIGTNILKLHSSRHRFEYRIEMIMKSKNLVEVSVRYPYLEGRLPVVDIKTMMKYKKLTEARLQYPYLEGKLPVVDINMSENQCSATLLLMSAYTNTCYMVDKEVENSLRKYSTRIEQVMRDSEA